MFSVICDVGFQSTLFNCHKGICSGYQICQEVVIEWFHFICLLKNNSKERCAFEKYLIKILCHYLNIFYEIFQQVNLIVFKRKYKVSFLGDFRILCVKRDVLM